MASSYCNENPDDPLCFKRQFGGLPYYKQSNFQQPVTRVSNVHPNPNRRKGTYRVPDRDGQPRRHDPTYQPREPPPPTKLRSSLEPKKEKRKVVGLKGGATRPIKASHTELTKDEIMKAKMLEAGKIAELEAKTTNIDYFLDEDTAQTRLQHGLRKAQEYLDKEGIKYTIEPELSTKEGLILINNETGIPKAVFRGTNFKNVSDLKTDLAIVHGQEDLTRQFKSAKDQVLRSNEIYEPVDEVIGFSLGGSKAITIGQELGIKSTTFNPAVSPSHLKNVPLNSGDNHTIIRTTENPTDILAGLKPSAFKIKSILPLNEPKWLNPESGMSVHDLANFSQTGNRRSNNIELLHDETLRQGKLHNEMVGIHDAKTAVENGKSLTEHLRNFSPNEVTREGTLGVRVQGDSKIFKMWEKAGGQITPSEQKQIVKNTIRAIQNNPNKVEDKFELSNRQVEDLLSKPEAVREELVQAKAVEAIEVGTRLNNVSETHIATRDALKASMSPANLGIGVVGSIAGAKVANIIDPNQKLGAVGHEALSGGLGGGFTAGAIATLGGEAVTAAAFAPAVFSSAIGAVAGYETNKAVAKSLEKAGANRDTIESISDITAGAVGGAATGLSGIAAAALLGAELGELGGVYGVALGAGVGALFGLGAYAIDAYKYNTPKAKAKREEQARLQDIANEAGYETYEEFANVYETEDTYNGKQITPEENYYHQVRVDEFGYDNMRTKPMNTEELLQAQVRYDERIQSELAEREFQRTDPYAAYQARRRGGATMGGAVPEYYQEGDSIANPYRSESAIQQAQTETTRESYGGVNQDGSVTPSQVSKVTQELQN
jgi:polyhydroxyalkanoate synthesis regulator phasin